MQIAHFFGYFNFQSQSRAGFPLDGLESPRGFVHADIYELYRFEMEAFEDRTAECTLSRLNDTLFRQ